MYARITTFNCATDKLDAATALATELKDEIMALPGIKFWFDLGNQDGSCAIFAVYTSQDAAEAAMPQVKEIFGKFSDFMTSEPVPVGYDVLLHDVNP